jgi:MYXO-CTERM domain-containing protein
MKNRIISIACFLTALLLADIASADMFVFAKNGQSRAQQDKDEGACHVWAVNRTGFDPAFASAPQVGPPPSDAAVVGTAAKGAVVGGIIGHNSSGGSAGRGAAWGAAAGVAVGRHRQRRQQQQMAAEQQALQGEQDHRRNEYLRAKAACLEGKGYTVK